MVSMKFRDQFHIYSFKINYSIINGGLPMKKEGPEVDFSICYSTEATLAESMCSLRNN